MATTAQVDAKIEGIRADVRRLIERQAAITALIADAWGQDTSALETEYAGNQAKLGGAEIVLERLARERGESQCSEAMRAVEKSMKANVVAGKQLNATSAALIEAFNALLAGPFIQYKEAVLAYQNATHDVRRMKEAASALGGEADVFDDKYPDPFTGETNEVRKIRDTLAPHYRPQP